MRAFQLTTYNHADWYVSEIVQLAARYGGIGPTGGGLINGWADRPALNQYDRHNYMSDQSWLTWRAVDCSAAALDWLLGAYGRRLDNLEDAIALIGPNTGISTVLGLNDARGPGLVQALIGAGLNARSPGKRPLGSIAELKSWLDQGLLLMDGATWFDEGHWLLVSVTTRTGSTSATRAAGTRAISPGRDCMARSASAVGSSASGNATAAVRPR